MKNSTIRTEKRPKKFRLLWAYSILSYEHPPSSRRLFSAVNPAEPELLHPHIIREIRARVEPALDDGRFACKERRHARAMAHLDAVAVDDDADGARAAEVTPAEGGVAILQQHKIAVAELVEAKADDFVVVGGRDVVIAACGACGADAAAHEVCGHARGDGHDELAILHGDVHLPKQVRVEVHAADAALKPFDLHALPLGAYLDAVADGELVERFLREIAEHMLHAAMGACHEAA